MHGGRADLKLSLDVRFGGRAFMHARVGVDERKILPLPGIHNEPITEPSIQWLLIQVIYFLLV